jgi:phage terminase large subunit-like protein
MRDLARRTGGWAEVWAEQGFLMPTPGNVIDYKVIRAALADDAERFEIKEVAYDRWGMTQLSQDLIEDGLTVVAMGQGFASMSAPTKEWLRLVAEQRWRAGRDPCARWQALNVVTRSDPTDNLKPDKARSVDKIDAVVAGIMGLDRVLRRPRAPQRRYSSVGF